MMRWLPLLFALALMTTCAPKTTPITQTPNRLVPLGETMIILPLNVDDWIEVVCVETFTVRTDQQVYGCLSAGQLRQLVQQTHRAN
jgi:hypothetical protein